MPEELKTTESISGAGEGSMSGDKEPDTDKSAVPETSAAEEPQTFDLAEDLLQLEKINLIRAVMIRIHGGRHPNKEIDALLKRRIDITADNHEIQGPYVVRLICTVMMIFVMSGLFWIFLWLLAASFELNYFARLFSTGMATLFAAAVGIAVFHPSASPDEKLVKQLINQNLELIRKELEESTNSKKSDSSNAVENNDLTDAFEEDTESQTEDSTMNDFMSDNQEMDEDAKKLALEGSDGFES